MVVLHHYLDLPLETVAEILGVPIGTVRSRLHHAMRGLRAALDADARPAAQEVDPMSTDRETTRLVRSWLEEGVTALPDRVLDAVLDQVPATPQRRLWSAWRPNEMNAYAKLLAGAAAVLVVAIVGYQFLPGRGPGSGASVAPSPTGAALIARGTFELLGAEVELNATGAGDSVTGTMTMSHEDGDFSVDLKCTRTTADGVILIAGDITDSKSPYARTGAREVIALKRGSPVYGSFDSEGRPGGDVTSAASCPALLQQVIDTGTHGHRPRRARADRGYRRAWSLAEPDYQTPARPLPRRRFDS